MDDSFGGNTTYYHFDDPIKEKHRFKYIHPETRVNYRVTISYEYNVDLPDALENKLLRSLEYSSWPCKLEVLLPLYSPELENISSKLYSTVTGLQFRTASCGKFTWTAFEDTEEIVAVIPIEKIHSDVPIINIGDLSAFRRLDGFAYAVDYCGERHVFKAHESPFQNGIFLAELFARLALGDIPHVLGLTGIVEKRSTLDGRSYVAGILMKYCGKGDLNFLQSRAESSVDWGRKTKWAAQITHGVMGIHQAGVVHGDLRCRNVVVDDNDDAYIIDIIDGNGYMDGWTCTADKNNDPRRDVYSLGVTLWEIARGGEQPVHPLKELDKDIFDQLVRTSVIEDASKRAELDYIFDMLGGEVACGCSESTHK